MSRRTAILAGILFAAIPCAEPLLAYSQLPETLATHFNLAGSADSWQSRSFFLATWTLLCVLMAVLNAGLGPFSAWMLEHHPKLVNLPKALKERAIQDPLTRERIVGELDRFGLLLGVSVTLLLALVAHELIRVNLGEVAQLDANSILFGMALVLLVSSGGVIHFWRSQRRLLQG